MERPTATANLSVSSARLGSLSFPIPPVNYAPPLQLGSTPGLEPDYGAMNAASRLGYVPKMAREAGFEPASSELETDSLPIELTPPFISSSIVKELQ
jgi:hypothetical protein